MKRRFTILAALAMTLMVTGTALAGPPKGGNVVTYTGQGLNSNPDGFGGFDLNTEICGIANGADADGPYLLWVLTATSATSATITGPWGTVPMIQISKGSFKYVSDWYDPQLLVEFPVSATFVGTAKNPQLVVSHGCRPAGNGWCSPGFWRNATDAAWALTGHTRDELFNATVFDFFYGATFASDPTLNTVLTALGGTFKGAPVAGTGGFALNAFNATGAFLTDNIPGFDFDFNLLSPDINESDTCPIDHFGNFK